MDKKLQSRKATSTLSTEWNYDRKNYSNDLLLGMKEDNTVQSIKMSYNSFTKLDLMRAVSLLKLHLNFNKIPEPAASEANYPVLQELSLAGNNIVELNCLALQLPQLQVLDFSLNRITKIRTKRSANPSESPSPVTFPELRSLNVGMLTSHIEFNRLDKLDIIPQDFPNLESLYVGFNSIKHLNVIGYQNLKRLHASTIDKM